MKTLIRAISNASTSLYRHPLRALLTGSGIFVGVLSVVVVLTLGDGADQKLAAQLDVIGKNLITVRGRATGLRAGSEVSGRLLESEARAIQRDLPEVERTAPVLDALVRVAFGDENTSVSAIGSTLNYFIIRGGGLASGTAWDDAEQGVGARVCVVGQTVVEELFGKTDPIGQSVRVGRHLFRVLGVLSEKGETAFGADQDNLIIMPIGAMRSKVAPTPPGEIRQILIAAQADLDLEKVKRKIPPLLRQLHGLKGDAENDFSVRDQLFIAKARQSVTGVMSLLLLSIAFISLFIGGIGVMNIMLVSVKERSAEIGLRMAVGASGNDILLQFLVEALVLSLLGGFVALLAAQLLLSPLEAYFGWTMQVAPKSVIIALSVSMAVGLIFGLLPARRAAALDPVDALRDE